MTRTEAIEQINRAAASLDDERVQVLLDVARKLADTSTTDASTTRALSARELRGLQQSEADFADGRVLDQRQYEASMTEFMSKLKASDKSPS